MTTLAEALGLDRCASCGGTASMKRGPLYSIHGAALIHKGCMTDVVEPEPVVDKPYPYMRPDYDGPHPVLRREFGSTR
jgi:hypothetical protein